MISILHLGDITKINGAEAPIVDVITGGSPCQDLSVAGLRKGLAGERSGLFMEQMRIVKEMRNESRKQLKKSGAVFSVRDIKPRFLVWENVTGAFSSGTPVGADFQAVLEEVVKVIKPDCPRIPIPNTGWPSAGNLDGVGEDGTPFSVSWRVHNACMWGVPQRRRRISLVADFGGTSAPEILFERTGMPWNSESSSEEGKRTPSATGTGIKESSTTGSVTFRKSSHAKNSEDGQGWEPTEVNDTLNTFDQGETRTSTLVVDDNVAKISNAPESEVTPVVFENHSQDTRFTELGETCQTVSATWGMGGNNQPLVVKPDATDPKSSAVVVENHPQDCRYRLKEDNIFPTMGARQGGEGDPNTLMVMETKKSEDTQNSNEPICVQRRFSSVNLFDDGITPTLEAGAGEGGNNMPLVFDQNKSDTAYAFEPGAVKRLGQNFSEEVSPTLRAQMGDNQVSVVYGISAYDSNSMKSDNPHSGIYEADSARTLDNNGGNPACNQGGMAIVQQIDNKSGTFQAQIGNLIISALAVGQFCHGSASFLFHSF